MQDLITIIVPVYMVERYLDRCVNSIVNQTYKNLEIILVDDGSKDQCPELCDSWAKKDERIRVIHRKNGGLSAARNSGIEEAKGEYLAFIDSDDFVSTEFIEALYQACQQTQSQIAQCRYEYVDGDTMTKDKQPATEPTEVFSGKEMIKGMSWRDGAYNVVAWNKLYHRSVFTGIRYPDGRIHEDEATTHRLFYNAKRVAFVYRFLYGYYTGGSSITRDKFSEKRLDWEWAVRERLTFLKERQETELLIPMYKIYMDGTIDLYYKVQEILQNEAKAEKLRKKLKDTYRELKKYGGIPLKTKIGYRIFLINPMVYKKLLRK